MKGTILIVDDERNQREVLGASRAIQTAVEAIKRGAFYYFEKPVDRARLLIIIERAIENLRLKESHRVLSERLFPGALPVIGDHPAIREIKRILPRIARSDAIGLLAGESGDGEGEGAEPRPKLLRALQDGEIRRVGGKENITVDVRIIAATNRDLEEEVKGGRFRADLFYRLNILKLFLPPLRERISDIPSLSRHFLARHGEEGFPPARALTKDARR